MLRLYSLGSWLCVSVSLALAVVAALAVPEGAFADSGNPPPPPPPCTNCSADCSYNCGSDNACYENCMTTCTGGCCGYECGSDGTCFSTCCQDACGTDTTCLDNCVAQSPGGCAGPTCNTTGRPCNFQPDCTDTKEGCEGTPPPGNDCSACICMKNDTTGKCFCRKP
jgi:hypothetical protein